MKWYNYLSDLLKQKDIRQNEIASSLDVTESYISRLMKGQGFPSDDILEKILDRLQASDNERKTIVKSFIKEKFGENSLIFKYREDSMKRIPVKEVMRFAWMQLKKNLTEKKADGTVYTTITDRADIYGTQHPTGKSIVVDPHHTPESGNTIIIYNNTTQTPTMGKLQIVGNNQLIVTEDGVIEIVPPYEILGVVLETQIVQKYL